LIQPNALYHADCLTLLERINDDMARTIYLDPPWFSQPVFRARNLGARTASGLRDYLENFARVLQQCHRVLADDGSIVVHADSSLAQKFNLLLGQVFRDNYIDDYILPTFRGSQGTRHDTLLHYGKSPRSILNLVRRPLSAEEGEAYPQSDERGAYRVVPLFTRYERPSLQFEWRGFITPARKIVT